MLRKVRYSSRFLGKLARCFQNPLHTCCRGTVHHLRRLPLLCGSPQNSKHPILQHLIHESFCKLVPTYLQITFSATCRLQNIRLGNASASRLFGWVHSLVASESLWKPSSRTLVCTRSDTPGPLYHRWMRQKKSGAWYLDIRTANDHRATTQPELNPPPTYRQK